MKRPHIPPLFFGIQLLFAVNLGLNNLFDYRNQNVLPYVNQDNTACNDITAH
jgi:hypothetical protein